jgi:hypothetical protein
VTELCTQHMLVLYMTLGNQEGLFRVIVGMCTLQVSATASCTGQQVRVMKLGQTAA